MTLKVFVAESGSLVRLRCDPPKDFWQHSSPSNNIIWRKKSPKDLIFHNNDNNGGGGGNNSPASVVSGAATKWKTAAASGQDIQRQQSLAPFSTSNADSSKLKRDLSADASYLSTYDDTHQKDRQKQHLCKF